MKRLILCDMDGVLANNEQRAHLLPSKDDCNSTDKWEAFNQACDQDEPIEAGFKILAAFYNKDTVWSLWSGRVASAGWKSNSWFWDHCLLMVGDMDNLLLAASQQAGYFRSLDDHRPAALCKADLVQCAVEETRLAGEDELILIDDDLSVLQECKARFPHAICVWIGGLHCTALANGVTTK